MSSPLCISYIRFSSAAQAEGTSLQRQLEKSRKYACEHGLILDETLSYRDLGKSAYSGDHIKTGRLGDLLLLIRHGKILRGTVLLVESLDRLSRANVSDALAQFQNIINEGIKIITLCDGVEYTKESIDANIGQLIQSLTIMYRANEESQRKSERITAAYEIIRKNLSTAKQTANCPGWLRLTTDRKQFDLLPERVEIVKRIYSLSFDGVGIKTITRLLNEEGTPAFRSSKGWCQSSVRKILSHRAVIGEFQPRKYNRVSRGYDLAGEPVPEYFPRILEDDVFNAVQARLSNGTHRAGRTAKVENLFGGITKCGYCGARMDVVTHGKFPDDARYLTCDSARRGFGSCNHVAFKCDELETAFLTYCREKDVLEVLNLEGKHERTKCLKLMQQISSHEGELLTIERQIALVDGDLDDCTDQHERTHYKAKLKSVLHRQAEIRSAIAFKQKEIDSLNASTDDAEHQISSILSLYESANRALVEGDRVLFRTKLRNQLRQIVMKVVVYTRGIVYTDDDINKAIQQETSDEEIQFMRQTQYGTKDNRFFIVYFKNANYRHIKYVPESKSYQVTAERRGNTLDWWMKGKQMKSVVLDNEVSQIDAEIEHYQRKHPDKVMTEEEIETMKEHLSRINDYD